MVKIRFPASIWRHRELIWRLSEREIQVRYRGSILGLSWSFVQPLTMLAVYTLVFSQVFKARWGTGEDLGPLAFAVNLFAGLIVFNLFSECLNRAPGLVLANPNYVKKVVFPLEVLAPVSTATALFHALTSLLVLVIFEITREPHVNHLLPRAENQDGDVNHRDGLAQAQGISVLGRL